MAEPVEPTQLTAHYEVHEGAVVVYFSGEVDLAVADEFGSCLDNALDAASAASPRLLIIELSALTFFCSHGISELLRCEAEGAGKGVAIKLSNCSPIVGRILQTTALDEILPVYPTVEDAHRSVAST